MIVNWFSFVSMDITSDGSLKIPTLEEKVSKYRYFIEKVTTKRCPILDMVSLTNSNPGTKDVNHRCDVIYINVASFSRNSQRSQLTHRFGRFFFLSFPQRLHWLAQKVSYKVSPISILDTA